MTEPDNNTNQKNKKQGNANKSNKELVRIGKFMSYILRHGIDERSLAMDNEGYILVSDLLHQPEMRQINIDDIMYIVEHDNKQRYRLKEFKKKQYIRANQGHCKEIGDKIPDNVLLTKIETPVPVCVHGTDRKSWLTIKDKGLSRMKRKHIHLASGLSDNDSVVSGMRTRSRVIIYINMAKAMEAGKTFYLSDNQVILTPDHLEPDLFEKVIFK
jgi:2'-phosphotransferase